MRKKIENDAYAPSVGRETLLAWISDGSEDLRRMIYGIMVKDFGITSDDKAWEFRTTRKDLEQECWIALWLAIDVLDYEKCPSPWAYLCETVHNCIAMKIRREKARKRNFQEYAIIAPEKGNYEDPIQHMQTKTFSLMYVEKVYQENERPASMEDEVCCRFDYERFLAHLTDDERKILALREAGHNQTYIGKVMGYSQSKASDVLRELQARMRVALA